MTNKLTVDIHGLVGFTESQKIQFRDCMDTMVKVINSDEFESLVRKYTYIETTGRFWWKRKRKIHGFKYNRFHEPNYIYNRFMSGQDLINRIQDGDIDIFATLYFSNKNTIGYTYGNTFKTWINKKFFIRRLCTTEGRAQIIGNVVHEYMHNLGYSHNRRHNSTRKHTVPYAYGYIAADISKSFF